MTDRDALSANTGAPGGTGVSGRTNLVVIFGGRSAEHDVSCVTAAHVMRAADPTKYVITAIGIDRAGSWHLAEGAMNALTRGAEAIPSRLEASGPAVSSSQVIEATRTLGDTVVVPLLHGPLGEDGTVQGLLELIDVPYVGAGVLASAVGMDKAMAKDVLRAHGIPQPRYVAVREYECSPGRLADVAHELGFPLFVKPANMGSSVGVVKAHDMDEFVEGARLAFTYDEIIVCEEAISGREIEVAVLGGPSPDASVAGEIVPGNEFYDYDDKYVSDGANLLIPAPISAAQSDDVRALAIRVFSILRGDGLARVDFFLEEGDATTPGRGFLCNEINTMPGFTPISMYPKLWQASGLSYAALIDRLVDLARQRHARKRHNVSR